MIIRDLGDSWQVVMQTDHADLSAAFPVEGAASGLASGESIQKSVHRPLTSQSP